MNAGHRILSPDQREPNFSDKCALAVMTKAPSAGRVKTRLTPPLAPEEAAELNKCFLQDVAAAIVRAGAGTQGVGCYEPVGAEAIYAQILPSSFVLLPQREATFGERLRRAGEDLFSVGFTSVCLIGSDSPTVPFTTYAQAAQLLAEPGERVVLGPSEDGGYYLIGMKRSYPRLFEEIAWSTEQVFEQTLSRAAELELPVQLLPVGSDVDDQETLWRLCNQLIGPDETEQSPSAPATAAYLQDLIRREGRDRIWGISSSSV